MCYGAEPHRVTEVYYERAGTLHDAFQSYYRLYGTKGLTEIHITEMKSDE